MPSSFTPNSCFLLLSDTDLLPETDRKEDSPNVLGSLDAALPIVMEVTGLNQ